MLTMLCIFIGAGIGGVLRFLLGSTVQANAPTWATGTFPLGTLAVNATGCFAIGLLATQPWAWLGREELRLGAIVGVLGGYTTFSAFSYECFRLFESGQLARACVYILLSNALGLGSALGGAVLARWAAR